MLTNTERQQIVEEVNAGTYGIDEALDDIAAAQKGEEVRKALYAEALVLNREGHAGSTDMIARQQVANLRTSVNGQISTLRTEVGDDIDDLEAALNNGLATQNATIANVVANYNVEYGSTELWASTGETGALAAGTTVTLSEDVSHFDYIDIYSFCGNSNVLDTVPVDAKLQSSQGYALRWVNLSDPDSGSYKAYVRIIETRLHIIGTTLTIDHQVTYRNGEEVNISGAEITQSNRSTYMGELGIMKIVGRKITANTEIEDVRIGADGTTYPSAGDAVRGQVSDLKSDLSINAIGLHQFDFESGTIENGVKAPTVRRIRLKNAIKVQAGDVVYINSPSALYYNIFLAESYSNETYSNIKYKAEYVVGSSTRRFLNDLSEVYIPFDGYLCIIGANGASWDESSDISVLDYTDEIVLVRKHGAFVKKDSLTFENYTNAVYVKASDGTTGANGSTGATDYIDISESHNVLIINNPNGQTHQGAFYDASKAYVGGYNFTAQMSEYAIYVPPNAKYIRLSYVTSLASNYVLYQYLDSDKWLSDFTNGDAKLKGKRLGIVGDSISTYSGFNPSGYATFYPRNTVINVEMTWWKQLLKETGMEMCVNASWSGSTISGDTTRADGYVGCSDARVNALTDGQGNTPDIIIVWMGINDFGKINGITCGSYDGTTAVSTATNITAITEAYGVLLKKLENKYPNAQIFVCRILPEQFASEMSASYANGFPNINPNDNISLPELNEKIEQIANAFGCGVIPMDKCGATFFNINTYTGDGLHPNALLTPKMCEIAKQTLLQLVN